LGYTTVSKNTELRKTIETSGAAIQVFLQDR